MEQTAEGTGFLRRHLYIILVSCAFLEACLASLWGAGLESSQLIPWSAFLTFLLTFSLVRFIRPVRPYPSSDIGLVITIILSLNLLQAVLGPDRHWLQPMYYLVIALCSLYYPLTFCFSAIGAVLVLEGVSTFSQAGGQNTGRLITLLVFGAYLCGTAVMLGQLFKSERKKKEKSVQAVKKPQEGAPGRDTGPGLTTQSVSPEAGAGGPADSTAELDRILGDILETLRVMLPAENALYFKTDNSGEDLYLSAHSGQTPFAEETVISEGQGLIGWVAREKKPILMREGARGTGYDKEGRVRSFVAAPVVDGGHLEGVIALDSPEDGAFAEPDKDALVRFGRVLIYLTRNARAYREADGTGRDFAVLEAISAEVSSSLDIKTMLERLARLSREILPYDYMTISFVEQDDTAVFKMTSGYDGMTAPDGPMALSGSLLGRIVGDRRPLCFPDMDKRSDSMPIFPDNVLKAEIRSFLGVPFVNQDKVLGVITFGLRKTGEVSAQQQQMLSIIANQVAVSITNARFHNMMQQLARTDGLTGLYNHRYFHEKAEEEFVRAALHPEPLSIVLLDIDHFRKVNEAYGHPVGDAILKKVAKLLKEAVRPVDTVARYGGEEFAALLMNMDSDGVAQKAEQVRAAVEKCRFLLKGQNIPVTVSVGHATWPAGAGDKNDLIMMAEDALHYAKVHGRNQCRAADSVKNS